jgi:dienelactone hydrolase
MGDFPTASPAQIATLRMLRVLMLCVSSLCISATGHAASQPLTDPHWVSFHSARAVPSALARRALGNRVDSARPRDALRGLLVIPEGEGPFPAVVLVHGCRGVLSSQRGWAQWLARQGFVALLVDSFFTRHASGVCSLGPQQAGRQEVSGRVFDAFGALEFLRRDPRVDSERIAIMGWNSWIPMSAVSRGGPRALARAGFSAAVVVSPDCPLEADRPPVPVLVVVAAGDELHAPRNCEWLAAHSDGAI